jgi:YHS domain-containing protein
MIGADTGPSDELVDMTRRFWIGLVLTVPVFVLEMGGHLTGLTERLRQQRLQRHAADRAYPGANLAHLRVHRTGVDRSLRHRLGLGRVAGRIEVAGRIGLELRPAAVCCGGHGPAAADDAGAVKDPVCGMTVDPHTAKHRAQHNGHPYYFCSNGCRTKFRDRRNSCAPYGHARHDPGRSVLPGRGYAVRGYGHSRSSWEHPAPSHHASKPHGHGDGSKH